jgi:hypothetical protein
MKLEFLAFCVAFSAVMAAAWGAVAWVFKPEVAVIIAVVVFLVMFGVMARTEEREAND